MAATIDESSEAQVQLPKELSLNVVHCDGRFTTLELATEVPSAILQGRVVTFESGAEGVVIWQRLPLVFVLCNPHGPGARPAESATLKVKHNCTIPVSASFLGQVVDYTGRPVDDAADFSAEESAHLFGQSTKQSDMATISKPLHTGITAVDSLTPIGKGQNMLVVGSLALGRRQLAIDAAVHQAKEGVACVYVSTTGGHRAIVEELRARDAMHNTAVVVADASSSSLEGSAEGVAAAAAGAALAEHLRAQGQDTLVVVDDLEQHKSVWDATERALVDKFGAEVADANGFLAAASSEMRAYYSTLFQRVGYMNKKAGGGSMSMLLLLDRPSTNDGGGDTAYTLDDFDTSIYGGKVLQRIKLMQERGIQITNKVLGKLGIPSPGKDAKEVKFKLQHIDELISLSDGQIVLNPKIRDQGLQPAIDSTLSVTRVGIGADNLAVPSSAAMRQVAARLRFDLAQATDIPPDDTTPAAVQQRARSKAWQSVLQQPWGSTRPYSDQIIALLAAAEGLLDDVFAGTDATLDDGQAKVSAAVVEVKGECGAAVAELEAEQQLSVQSKNAFKTALRTALGK